ncbi:MAG: phosphotransferase [Candidatus Zixiibacteriota bacterium]|nr:MAG: phosphotransferase [candidate division Zixibacteria bacterium]
MDIKAKRIFERHRDFILQEAAERYACYIGSLTLLGSFESIVYEYDDDDRNFILKISDSIHRSADLIKGEMEWVDYLADNGVPVCRALPSRNGKLVETVPVAGIRTPPDFYFSLVAIEKARGTGIRASDWNDRLIAQWGQITGRIHALAKKYHPPDSSHRRFDWRDDGFMLWRQCNPATHSQPVVVEKCRNIIERLHNLPINEGSYGLIHADLHHWNFLVHNGSITIFDTDDCRYDWFAHDIAIPLAYSLFVPGLATDRISFAVYFLSHFLSGYRRENTIDPFWIEQVPVFMKLRELDLYMILLNEDPAGYDGWCRNFMKNRRWLIENDMPLVDIDFSAFK